MKHELLETDELLSWQDELRQLITQPQALFSILGLPADELDAALKATTQFPLRATHSYVKAIRKGDRNDPLLLQILPVGLELSTSPEYSDSPLKEHEFNPTPGLIHKYQGRVLLVGTSQCAINCRYCFRRNFDYQANSPTRKLWGEALEYIRCDRSIEEVILSGGDPLTLSNSQLRWLANELERIPHVARLRVHSRLPVVLPSRIDEQLVEIFSTSRLDVAWVIHCNHPQELTSEVGAALEMIRGSNIALLNQSVLLKNINDCAKTLGHLSKRLFSLGVLPYYLHVLDKVSGAAHFDIPENQARLIHQEMVENLSGYLVPKLVKEVPHAASKTPV